MTIQKRLTHYFPLINSIVCNRAKFDGRRQESESRRQPEKLNHIQLAAFYLFNWIHAIIISINSLTQTVATRYKEFWGAAMAVEQNFVEILENEYIGRVSRCQSENQCFISFSWWITYNGLWIIIKNGNFLISYLIMLEVFREEQTHIFQTMVENDAGSLKIWNG